MKSTPRVKNHRQEAAKLDRKRKECLATDDEWKAVKALLKDLRG